VGTLAWDYQPKKAGAMRDMNLLVSRCALQVCGNIAVYLHDMHQFLGQSCLL